MIVLGLESATIEVGVALHDESGPLAALVARPGRRHVETLHPAIEAVCAAASVSLCDVGAVAVDIGPGRYTGIRVGIAAAQGLCLGLGIPAITCRSTDVLLNAGLAWELGVLPIIDMRRGELAWPTLSPTDGEVPDEADAVGLRLGTVDELIDELVAASEPRLLVGDGARRYGAAIIAEVEHRGGPRPHGAGEALAAPPVAALARLGFARAIAGETTAGEALRPLYLRPPDVRINWSERAQVAATGRNEAPA